MSIRRVTKPLQEPYCWNCGGDANGRQLLTVVEAAKYCNVSINTLYRWMEKGLIEWVYNAGGKRRIYKDSVLRRPDAPITVVRESPPVTSGSASLEEQ